MFYVYVYRDPRPTKNNQPVYVGKGTGDRDISHWSRGSHNKPFQDFISHLKLRGLIALCQRVYETENEQEAFAKEMQLIELYGRRDLHLGSLFNLTDGGEGASGAIRTEEEKQTTGRFSKAHWQDPEYRIKTVAAQIAVQSTPEAKATKSKNSKKMWAEKGEIIGQAIQQGRSTEASRDKTRKQAKAQWADPAYKEMQTANNKEIANRPEVKAAKAAATKALWADPEFRARMKEARAKKHNLTSPT